ncbi:thermonuclease family protein [Candidatus Amarolinea aalborgensis]|uniref:thermonuclease family protein n=1 Tax=Candidatus Amarolinea aalborgensis TaxID=2249329 RepID=UPI003BF9CC2F
MTLRLMRRGLPVLLLLLLSACQVRNPGESGPLTPTVTPSERVISVTNTPTRRPAVTPTPTPLRLPNYPEQPLNLPRATVLSVIDGDTIDVRVGGQVVSVRLLGINTPEVPGPYRTAQCFGNEASANAKRLLAGATVYLQDDPQQDDKDQYGRWLRYVWLSDGRLFNLEAIAQGFALEYTYYKERPYSLNRVFRDAQRLAQEQQLGLWSPQTCDGDIKRPPLSATTVAHTPAVRPTLAATAVMRTPTAAPAATRSANSSIAITGMKYAGGDEVVTLTNQGTALQSLDGWRLQSYGGSPCRPVSTQVFVFPTDFTLEPGASVRVHSGPQAVNKPPTDLAWTADTVWSNSGDRADLLSADGQLVTSLAYGACQ